MLYHISTEVYLKEKVFTPRIPKHRLQGENQTIKRISTSNAINSCINSFPYGKEIMWYYRSRPVYLAVYSIDENNFDSNQIRKPQEIIQWVKDSESNQEHRIMKEFSAKPKLIKVTNLQYNMYCKYTGDYLGEVANFVYEKDVEDYERVEKATFYHSKYFREFMKICRLNGIEVLDLSTNKERMNYFGFIESSRVYNVKRVTYKIPIGVSANQIWNTINKEIRKNKSKHLVYKKTDFKIEEK